MKNIARTLALLYAATVVLAAAWAWYAEVTLLHRVQEHLLPGLLLVFVSLPASLTTGFLYEQFPRAFESPFVQLTWLTGCGACQATALYLLSTRRRSARGVA
jgi:hypothetical protein